MYFYQKISLISSSIFLILFSCSGSEDAAAQIAVEDATTKAPNIVFIIADDMGWDVFGKYIGDAANKASTPVLDSLATRGVTFTNFWANPECSPTRAAILTGRYGFRTSVGGVESPQVGYLKSTETVIQKYINDNTSNAYATALIGKWHVSLNSQLDAPESFGIQYYSGFLNGAVSDYYNWTQTSNGVQSTITTYATTQFVDQSVAWMKQQTKPFFLWLAFNAPHTPFHRPPLNLISDQSLSDDAATINTNPFPYYLASIEAMDKEIGRMIHSMTAEQKENTVFVVIGDNGTPSRVARTPYTSSTVKSTLYQGGVNTPMIICGKNVSRVNQIETSLVQAPDLFVTFADIAGTGTTVYQDGVTVKPLLSNSAATKRTFAYSELFTSVGYDNEGYTLRNDSYKLIHLTTGSELLYKISSDPFEQSNLLLSTLSSEAQTNLDNLRQVKLNL
ncbi:sulfatase-like hydrolase/transferase [Flavobacterium algicola]|uniref:sulfatase-like hydrolase/transferase n=1 Tax=Flavobacterium algicola TaxID=556529 RepID=UPI001EFED1DF|nr:sulfatase-like hydrolase/transferase [Flavobacterium algicola]MCG9791603.1 sulfatase-like hydrolase/transferase [Flavobacterium algicola]